MRFRPKFGLRFLLIAATVVPLLIWGGYQYQIRQQQKAARARLAQIASMPAGTYEPIRSHFTFQTGDSLLDLTFGRQPDPLQLLADCRQAGARIRSIRLTDQCLVDITLARRIAAIPDLANLYIEAQTQIEPEAIPILLAAAPDVVLPADLMQSILKEKSPPSAPRLLALDYLPSDPDEFIELARAAVKWQPRSLVLFYQVDLGSRREFQSEGTNFRARFSELQLANPQMLISLSEFWGHSSLDGTSPIYPWKNEELKALEERTHQNDVTTEECQKLIAKIRAEEPDAWPILQADVLHDFEDGNFDSAAVDRAKKLVELAPWYPQGHLNIGMSHYVRGEYAQAIEPLERGIQRAELGFGNDFQLKFIADRGMLFLAAAHVAAGKRTAGLRALERQLVSTSPDVVGSSQSEKFAAFLLIGIWIQCTAPNAGSEVAKNCDQQLAQAVELLTERGALDVYADQIHWTQAVLACRVGDFVKAQAEYAPFSQTLPDNVKPRFRSEFKRLGEAIKQRKPFVTDYVPVVPFWD